MSQQLIAGLPVMMNLSMPGDPREVIGWASAEKREDGTMKIEIILDPEASAMLENLAEVFDLKALGFAGIKKRPQSEDRPRPITPNPGTEQS